MKRTVAVSLVCATITFATLNGVARDRVTPVSATRIEFAGPFPSWSNVRTQFGASGDGKADDTKALQRALDAIAGGSGSPIAFLPAGVYRITRTLSLASALHVGIVGADPASTTIFWDGEADGTMLAVNGVAYSTVARVTFDGERRARTAVDQSWDGQRPNFDTGNQYVDDRFVDVGYGIRGGFKGHGFAETTILRARFLRNSVAGVSLGNFNALDAWIWRSLFEDCETGITNSEGAGNFHVYDSVFRRSRRSDLMMANTGSFSARGNDSRGSGAFFVSSASKAYPAVIHLQRNLVIDPVRTPVDLLNQGPGLLTDNTFAVSHSVPGPAVRWTAFDGADVTSIGNTFSSGRPYEINGRLITIDDRRLPLAAARFGEPIVDDPPRPTAAAVVEVGHGASARDIQSAFDKAAAVDGTIVHLPFGTYGIDRTLIVPPALRIIGDGARTLLRWAGRGSGAVFQISGPSRAVLNDFKIDAAGGDGIVIDGADAPHGIVTLDGVQLRSARRADLLVDGLDRTVVEARDLGHAYSPAGPAVRVAGGSALAAGADATGGLHVFSGAASGNGVSYEVTRGGRVLVRDFWYESGASPGFATVRDRGLLAIDGARIASAANSSPAAIVVAAPDARVAVLATHLDDRIAVAGDGSRTRVLSLSSFDEGDAPSFVVNTSIPGALVVVANSRRKAAGRRGNASVAAPDAGEGDRSIIAELAAYARSAWPRAREEERGSVDITLTRVWIENGGRNLTIAR